MRKSIALTDEQVKHQNRMRRPLFLAHQTDAPVNVSFTKQDGTERILSGIVEDLKGEGDKEVVLIKTDAGIRSANLHRIKAVY